MGGFGKERETGKKRGPKSKRVPPPIKGGVSLKESWGGGAKKGK